MRALLATAGLLVLAGTAAAGSPSPHTLRKSPSGPIEAIAQDGAVVAWFSSSTKTCDAVHMLAPGTPDRTLPQPMSGSKTCHWDLSDGQSQLAVASGTSTALWTLHESGPAPFDYVLAATAGGPERQLGKLAHASDGTGDWLGGVAGSGTTLAYSWVDVEYVDKLACLSGGSCKQKIADGGIRVVTKTGDQALPKAEPALQLAAAGGRIAYVPATTVKDGKPVAGPGSLLYVVDGATGTQVAHAYVRGAPLAIALSPSLLVVLTRNGPRDRILWFDATGGTATKLGSAVVSSHAAPKLAASDQLIVYRVGNAVRSISTANGKSQVLATTDPDAVGLSLGKGQLIWAENDTDSGRLRALAVGS
ncbi:MAG TPA: hypothetical protein VJ814_04615 [Gaiellaceae bacterium]|nr:hypothetical protein [Gaiellaceae bacterium]